MDVRLSGEGRINGLRHQGDRGANQNGRIRFGFSIVPSWLRNAKPLPRLHLKGISTGGFGEALVALHGPDAEGLSASAVTRLKASRAEDCDAWRKKDLSSKRVVHARADRVHLTPRLDGDRQCMPVLIGADDCGEKDVLAVINGFRGNADSWRDLLPGLKARGLAPPEPAAAAPPPVRWPSSNAKAATS